MSFLQKIEDSNNIPKTLTREESHKAREQITLKEILLLDFNLQMKHLNSNFRLQKNHLVS